MADKPPVEGRTAYIKKNMPDGVLKSILVKGSELVDDMGFTQQKEYEGKTREEVALSSLAYQPGRKGCG